MSARKRLAMRVAFGGALACAAFLGAACPGDQEVVHKTAIEHGAALADDSTVSGSSFNQLSCAMCHDEHAGDSGLKKAGAPLAGALSRPTYWGGSVDTLLGSVNACLYYFMQANDPWRGDEDDAKAIYAYLESLDKEASDAERAAQPFSISPLTSATAGDAAHGEIIYTAACADCHGAKSTGDGSKVKVAPILPDQTLKAHPSPTYSDSDRRLIFVEKTRHGGFLGYGGQMPPLSAETLSDQDVVDMLTYLGVP